MAKEPKSPLIFQVEVHERILRRTVATSREPLVIRQVGRSNANEPRAS